tara:strand:+ start:342 stop:1193 length:852 start_codon:yes stop_codon:yes gene_type:complete
MFSIIIPTFNNLNYLKLCIESIKKNSVYDHELLFHINEGSDGSLEYIKENKYKYSYSKKNQGVCVAYNEATKLAKNNYIVLAHDDMYFCPGWDTVFNNEIKNIPTKNFFISGTMVQYFGDTYIKLDCGKTYENFNEEKLLKELPKIKFDDFQGTHWQPSLISLETWNRVGGFSLEFSPGLGSDPDFNMKLWKMGVRFFKGLGNCRVYHFSSVTLRRKAWNNGAKTFLLKWGITIKFFRKYYLRINAPFNGELREPDKTFSYYINLIKCKCSFMYYYLLLKLKI